MTNGGAVAAAGAAAIAQAIKASGAIVKVEPLDFMALLERVENPLVVYSESRFWGTNYHYLMGYKGLVFYTKSRMPFMLPEKIEIIVAKKIWIPSGF